MTAGWTVETGLFAANSTVTMLNGKAYYRAVRRHLWTYEAIRRILWERILQWLSEKNQTCDEIKTEVKRSVSSGVQLFQVRQNVADEDILERVNATVEVLRSAKIQKFIEEFRNQHSNEPNLQFWNSFLSMVETLLDLIRANREGN